LKIENAVLLASTPYAFLTTIPESDSLFPAALPEIWGHRTNLEKWIVYADTLGLFPARFKLADLTWLQR
jgi:hypothetical protein